jgi:hypothetical protein
MRFQSAAIRYGLSGTEAGNHLTRKTNYLLRTKHPVIMVQILALCTAGRIKPDEFGKVVVFDSWGRLSGSCERYARRLVRAGLIGLDTGFGTYRMTDLGHTCFNVYFRATGSDFIGNIVSAIEWADSGCRGV